MCPLIGTSHRNPIPSSQASMTVTKTYPPIRKRRGEVKGSVIKTMAAIMPSPRTNDLAARNEPTNPTTTANGMTHR